MLIDFFYTLRAAKQRIPAGLFEVVERALSKEPGERYATASELSRALAPYTLEARKAKGELSGWVAYASDAASAAPCLSTKVTAAPSSAAIVSIVCP